MSALAQVNIKVGSNKLKTASMVIERVTRSATVSPVVRDGVNQLVTSVERMKQHKVSFSSFSGLVSGDEIVVILQTSGDNSSGSNFIELPVIRFINGTECVWTFSIPSDWNGSLIVSALHKNYGMKQIGYRFFNLK